jgi:tetratricopeptide (TPR) repeat protein
LLGEKYGIPTPLKSGTHLEYDHAKTTTPPKPVFAYVLTASKREPRQEDFIRAVLAENFTCPPITSIEELKKHVKNSLWAEFVHCFRSVHQPPASFAQLQASDVHPTNSPSINLQVEPDKALRQIESLYNDRQEVAILQIAAECKTKFKAIPEIMNVVYMAQVNLAMQGVKVNSRELLDAIAFWDKAEAKKRWAVEGLLYNQGNAFGALGLQPEAINRYKESLAIKPDAAQCWVNLGNAYSASGDISAAWECFQNALNTEPNLFQALYSSATIAMRDNQKYEVALQYMNRIATSQLPAKYQAAVHSWKANVLLKLHRYTKGIAEAENALAMSPDKPWAWQVAGRLYALARQEDKKWLPPALSFWERFVGEYPNNARAWAEIGYVCWFLREVKDKVKLSERSLKAFENAVELGFDDDALVLDRIGHLYQEHHNWIKAEPFFRKASALDDSQFGLCWAVSLMHLDRHSEALPLLLAAAEQHQPDAMSWHKLGICYERTGKIDGENILKAEAAYKRAIEIDPNYPGAWFDLGGFYWNQHDIASALSIWKSAIKKFPEDKNCERVKAFSGPLTVLFTLPI